VSFSDLDIIQRENRNIELKFLYFYGKKVIINDIMYVMFMLLQPKNTRALEII